MKNKLTWWHEPVISAVGRLRQEDQSGALSETLSQKKKKKGTGKRL
jgi:hypothetical protein